MDAGVAGGHRGVDRPGAAASVVASVIAFVIAFVVVLGWSQSWVVALGAAALAGLAAVWCFPITKCRWCAPRGGPKTTDRTGNNWREACWSCDGAGKRRRFLTRFIGGWGL